MSAEVIQQLTAPLDAEVKLPGSKSLTNRALVAAALSEGHTVLSRFLFADDTNYLLDGLATLGISIRCDRAESRVELRGCAGHLPVCAAQIDCGESGTMLRFLSALCATATGEYRLSGAATLCARPMGPLVAALRRLGARVAFEDREDHAPLVVHGRGLHGGEVRVDATQSSQFVSAMLLAAPCARSDVFLEVAGGLVSASYVKQTCAVMKQFGVDAATMDHCRFVVPAPQYYVACNLQLEADASSAGYFLGAAAICGGRVRVKGLACTSVQGDVVFCDILEHMGCRVSSGEDWIEVQRDDPRTQLLAGDWDLQSTPDLVPTVAVLALFANGQTHIRNVAHLRVKESDRLAALQAELQRVGAEVAVHLDGLTITPPKEIAPALLKSHGDHRIAMALSLVGLRVKGMAIENSECVSKSLPGFFPMLQQLGAQT